MRRPTIRSMPTAANYKVEKVEPRWAAGRDAAVLAGNNLDKARRIFGRTVKHRPADPADDPPAHTGVGRVATA